MQFSQPGTPIAETITPDIQALADGLQDDPVKIFNYVHDHIRYVLYFGSKKGAELTLLEKSGNDFDQSALLVALLEAAGYNNVTYRFGWIGVPYNDTSGNEVDFHHWLQLSLPDTNSDDTLYYLSDLFGIRGYPQLYQLGGADETLLIQHVWVAMDTGTNILYLDPSFKVSEPVTNQINLASAMGFGSNTLMSAVGGTDTGTYAQSLSEANLRNTLTGYTTNLLNYLQSNAPNASVEQILGGWQITPSTNSTISQIDQNFPFLVYTPFGMNVVHWTNEPTSLMSSFTISFARTNYQWWIPQLQGDRVTLLYTTNGVAQLWQDDNLLVSNATTASDTNVVFYVNHPFGTWDTTNNALVDDGSGDQISTNVYQRTNATYNIAYAFEPDWGWLKKRQNQLDIYLQQGLPSTSRQVVSETLNIMGLTWMLETAHAEQLVDGQSSVLQENLHRFGRTAQEAGHGYYVDVYLQNSGIFSSTGEDPASQDNQHRAYDLVNFFESAMEYGLIEQMQSSNLVGASTVKMLQIANTNGQAVYLANNANWSSIQGSLVNYSSGQLASLNSLTANGYYILLPQNGSNPLSGAPGSWKGYGAAAFNPSSGAVQMVISGGYFGGASGSGDSTTDPYYTDSYGDDSMFYFFGFSPFTFGWFTGDPVDVADGTLQVEHTDLSIGGPEPRGITLSRYYNGTRRFNNTGGMTGGWVNNYCMNVIAIPAPELSLGGSTPTQAAPMLAATAAALGIYNDLQPDPKNWLTTALITKWGVDQLIKNGISVAFGKETVEFIKQPNGAFTPPGNCTMTLIQTNGVYWLQKRHDKTFMFNSVGLLTNIVDQYGQSLNLTYNSSNWVSTVKDWKNRQFTFNYSGTPSRLTSVSDGTRTINYGYSTAYNSQGDLASFTDAENKTTTYTYDTNHEITAVLNASSQMVVSNVYDSQGHVTTQYTQGDPNKTWRIFWSGWQTVAQDPAGGQQTYFYDDQSRLIGFEDALNNLTQTFYDGQDHVVMTVSPLNEINQYFYDGNNNLIQNLDPLGFTNQFVYDNQNNLIRSVDGRGNPTTFGYNAQFSLTGQTNGAGDWVNYTYTANGALAGTLASKTDPGGTTSYSYDSTYGQLTNITYPGGLGSEGFANNAFGDVTSRTDPRGFATTFQYNNRRELTNTIAPTNLTTSVAYDAADNVASTIDARRNTTTQIWSVTRKLLATILPAMSQGTPIITNFYDSRDYLTKTLDPLQNPTLYTNNLNGWLISQTDPLLRTTTFGFDADGRKLTTVNAANETNSQTWDARGKLIALTDGANHASLRAYDGAGNQIILTNRNGKVWRFQFDGANRLTNTITPLNRTMSQTWNHQGLLSTVTDPTNRITYFYYDAKGRLTNRTDNVGVTLYRLDAGDNVTNVSENGLTNSWTFDAYNRVSSYKDVYGNLIQYRRDANGNVTNLVYPGGKNVYYMYDNDNHLTQVKDWSGRITSLTYDLAGRLTSITRPNGTQRIISYDAAGQITNILEESAVGFPIALLRHQWNNAAEMRWEFAAPLPHTNAPPSRTMTYDDDNRLATVDGGGVALDANGNLTYGPLTNDNFVTYTFDARNRLLNVGGVTNVYDPLNNRIGQTYGTNTTIFVVNPDAKLPQALERIKNGVTNYYIYGAGLLYQITETATSTNTLTYHYDFRGSTIALTDDNGNVKDRFEYSLYATLTYRAGSDDTPFLFNGRYGVMSDPNGLLYMQARYYSPYICRFINPDPSGFAGGMNFYAYANGNPVSYLDPFGLNAWTTGDSSWSWLTGGSTWNPNEFYQDAAAWQNSINNSYSWPVAGTLDTLLQMGAGIASIPYLGSGSGFYAANPSWQTAPGLLGDIGTGAGLLAGGLSPFSFANASLFGGGASGTTSVFWSGFGSRTAAETWATGNGGQTLSMSPFAVGEDATLAETQSASTAFASGASGNIQVFQPAAGVPVEGIWAQYEFPALMQNPNVTTITYNIIDSSGNIISTITVP